MRVRCYQNLPDSVWSSDSLILKLASIPLAKLWLWHGLSQQGVWVSFWTHKPLKSTHQDTQILLRGISLKVNLKHIIEFFHHHWIPMTLHKDIMLYFDKYIHVYGWNLSLLWSSLKIWTPKNFTMANFRHPVSYSWLRPWALVLLRLYITSGHFSCTLSLGVLLLMCVWGGGGVWFFCCTTKSAPPLWLLLQQRIF